MGTLEEVWNELNDFKTFKNHINCDDHSIEFTTKVVAWQKKLKRCLRLKHTFTNVRESKEWILTCISGFLFLNNQMGKC
jgi:hypothetical protein